jgi:hypothetical protein
MADLTEPAFFLFRFQFEALKCARLPCAITKEKPPEGGLPKSIEVIAYAAFSAIAFFRRYAMKPMPANPRIIMAHVEGSGTAATCSP